MKPSLKVVEGGKREAALNAPVPDAAISTSDAVSSTTTHSNVIRLSDEQTAIAEFVMNGKGNLLVRARAGTGKTFLLRQCVPLMGGRIAICAYNNKIAKEIRKKVGDDGYLRSQRSRLLDHPGCDVGTFHSFGWGIIRSVLPNVRIEGNDASQAGFYKFTLIAERLNIPQPLRACVRKAMERAQERGFGVGGMIKLNDPAAWLDLADHYGLSDDLPENGQVLAQMLGVKIDDWSDGLLKVCLKFAAKAINVSLDMVREKFTREVSVGRGKYQRNAQAEDFVGVISFGEMLYLPLVWNMPFPQYDRVLVDEAQDSNPVRREMARRMLAAKGQMMWVGDDRQAINGWTGADNDALTQISEQFACTEFPMTVTFRCGKAIVAKAQTLVPDYKAADSNPDGEVREINEEDFYKQQFVWDRGDKGTGDAIICRNTRPLIEIAYKLLAANVPCHVEGRDIGRGLIALLDRWPHLKNLPALRDKLEEHKERETARLLAAKKEMQAEALNDQVETLYAIMGGLPKGSLVSDLTDKVNSLFADTETDDAGKPKPSRKTVTLLTAHRSKGLEFTCVYGFGVEKFIPSKWAKQKWQLQQEENLEYVLYTRAINKYVDVKVAA